jgi:preprotein translocase subunit YajC
MTLAPLSSLLSLAGNLHAMAPSPAAGAEGGSAWLQFLPFGLIIVLFYWLLIRPQQKQANERKKLLSDLKGGEDVITVSGVYGKIVKVNEDDTMILKISDSTNIKVTRQAIERLQK